MYCLVGHLQRLASFNEDPVLSSNPGAHHDSCWRCQPQRAGAGNGQNCDGRLEGKADNNFRLGDVLVITLWGWEWVVSVIAKCLLLKLGETDFVCIWKHLCAHLPGSFLSQCQSSQTRLPARQSVLAEKQSLWRAQSIRWVYLQTAGWGPKQTQKYRLPMCCKKMVKFHIS